MAKKAGNETLIPIEETQAALRDCIEQTKGLVKDSERLVRRYRDEQRDEPVKAKPPNPAM